MAYTGDPWKSPRKGKRFRSHRENYYVHADFVVEGRFYMGVVKNKSGSGVFVQTMEPFQVGQDVTLTVMPPGERKPIKRKGKVVRSTPSGFGVEFT
jgi:hypothetical protein